MATPEGKVKNQIKSWIKKNIPDTWHFLPVSNGMGKHGICDFIMCVPRTITQDMVGSSIGMFVGIEAKTETGRLSKYQEVVIGEIRDASGMAFVIKGKPEEIHDIMDSIGHVFK